MYALLVKRKNEDWDYYPDPLKDTEKEVLEKISYLKANYAELESEYKCKKLSAREVDEHTKQWKKWISMID